MRKDNYTLWFFEYYFLNFKKCNILHRGPVDFYEPPNMYIPTYCNYLEYMILYIYLPKNTKK